MLHKDLILRLGQKSVLTTPRLVAAFSRIDRKDFVPTHLAHLAYEDDALPIGYGQTISQPYTVAFMLELLQPEEGNMVLDIGSGSGWQTALLAEAVGETGKVYALEIIPELCEMGKTNIGKYSFLQSGRVIMKSADATSALPHVSGGFDRIIAAAAGDEVPEAWLEALKVGGRLVTPIKDSIWLYVKKSTRAFEKKEYPGFAFVSLVHSDPPSPEVTLLGKSTKLPAKKYIAGAFLFILMFGIGYLVAPVRVSPQGFLIPKGASAREVAQTLKNARIIHSQNLFLLYLRFQGGELSLRPGTYHLEGAYSIPKLARLFTSQSLDERTVVIPEGLTLAAVSKILESAGVVASSSGFLKTALHPSATILLRFSFLRALPSGSSLEGYLFPDTYKFFAGSNPEDIIARMLEIFEKRVTQNGIFDKVSASKRSLREVLTLASILEEEAATTEDRELIAGILLKRLAQDLPMQVDSTLMYVTGRGTRLLTPEDLELDSPYNTYRYKGLPAGPISNPGVNAIESALHSKSSPYFYYLSDSSGKIHYAKSFEEHKTNKIKYLK